jgi:TatD DNase family protein
MLVDTHTHLNFKAFNDDWREVVDRAVSAGVDKMIVVSTDIESSERAIDMANDHPALFASIGVHPHHVRGIMNNESGIKDLVNKLRRLAKYPKVVAIGEIGLDNHSYGNSKYRMKNSREESERIKNIQKRLLEEQIKLAKEFDKPLILHSRAVKEEVLDAVLNTAETLGWKARGVFHCFEGSNKYLKTILDAGFFVSFTGNITYSPDRSLVAKKAPLKKLLLETDCPFMSPHPFRKERNEPSRVKIIAEYHAVSRSLQLSEVIKRTTENAKLLFGL